MKPVLIINPNTSASMTESIRHGARQANGDGSVDATNVPWGPISVETELDSLLAASAVVELIWERRNDYSGFAIACFDDPGLAEVREIVTAPVVGIGEAAILRARDAHSVIGVIVVSERVVGRVREHFGKYEVSGDRLRFASLDGCVLDLDTPSDAVSEQFVNAAQQLVMQGAECVVLACAGFSHAVGPISDAVGVPVMDGNRLSIELLWSYLEAGGYEQKSEAPQPFEGVRPSKPTWQERSNANVGRNQS